MLLLSLDFETTGLDRANDRAVEIGAALYSTNFDRVMVTKGYFIDNDIEIPDEAAAVNGIRKGMIDKFGIASRSALEDLLNLIDMSEAVIGQNIVEFDWPFVTNWAKRENVEVPDRLIIDTKTDLPGVEGKHLGYMLADAGVLNVFPHSGVADCMAVIKLLSVYTHTLKKFTIEDVVARAKSPRITIVADVSYDNNHLAKKRKFGWNAERKVWFKNIKECDLDKETQGAPFVVRKIDWIPFH